MIAPKSYEEIQQAPSLIQFLWINSMGDFPIGLSAYQKAMREHPEYFPDEIARQERWDKVPQEVHDAYWKEFWQMSNELHKDSTPNKGMIYWCDHPEEYEKWKKDWDKIRPIEEQKEKELHKKYYEPYGV